MTSARYEGRVEWYDPQRGYGFVVPNEKGMPDCFVHASALNWAGISILTEGQRVSYEVRFRDAGKIAASNIKLIEDAAA